MLLHPLLKDVLKVPSPPGTRVPTGPGWVCPTFQMQQQELRALDWNRFVQFRPAVLPPGWTPESLVDLFKDKTVRTQRLWFSGSGMGDRCPYRLKSFPRWFWQAARMENLAPKSAFLTKQQSSLLLFPAALSFPTLDQSNRLPSLL